MYEVYTSLDRQGKQCIMPVTSVWLEKSVFNIVSQGPVGLASSSNMYWLPPHSHPLLALHDTELYRELWEEHSCLVQAEQFPFSHLGGIKQ